VLSAVAVVAAVDFELAMMPVEPLAALLDEDLRRTSSCVRSRPTRASSASEASASRA